MEITFNPFTLNLRNIIIEMDIIALHDFTLTHDKEGNLIFSIVFPPINTPTDYKQLR